MGPETGTVTQLLGELRGGNRDAESKLLDVVYQELHQIAERYMRSERSDHTLQATALVNEAYMRLLANDKPPLENRKHFFAVAAQVMRRILVDYARAYRSQKRGGDAAHVSLEDPLAFTSSNADEVIALDEALSRLAKMDERQSRIVEFRYYVGLTEEEIAQLLSISPRTVKREWRMAKAWLYAELRAA
jgi:RNA polymerase sigma factor (TIGR02999 family)